MVSTLMNYLRLCIIVLALTACGPVQQQQPQRPTALDSISIVRTQSYFHTGPAYRIRVSHSETMLFESRMPGDSGRVVIVPVEPGVARGLLERAISMRMDTIPIDIVGKQPYCRIVATDAPSVIIGIYTGATARHIRDYLGCSERNDESPGQLVQQIRAFMAAVDSAAGVSRLFGGG
jgi:hypothetical protein